MIAAATGRGPCPRSRQQGPARRLGYRTVYYSGLHPAIGVEPTEMVYGFDLIRGLATASG
jgi:hypothetical protein